MEARRPSECGVLRSWNLFEVKETGARHLIGYAPAFDMDVITDELVHFSFNRTARSGQAITQKGIVYELSGKPLKLSLKWHPQVREFTETHQCRVKLIKIK